MRLRVVAAAAALLTALLLQATLVGPVTLPVPVSLPAVLVAAVALHDGPGTGLAFGFAAGLVADLGSDHPAGVLALCWMAVGIACGLARSARRWWADAVLAALACALATVLATFVLRLLGVAGASGVQALRDALPALLGDVIIAAAVVPLTRRFLRATALRPPARLAPLGGERRV